MQTVMRTLAPSATTQLRADHAHVLTTFHQFEVDESPQTKHALVNSICRALDIHAQLEEQLFYPEMQRVVPALVEKSVPEHAEMRRLIATLMQMQPTHPQYDPTFLNLMRIVIHHVSDEETMVFPEAERLLGDTLNEIGAHMAVRRIELTVPQMPDMARESLSALPSSLMFAAAGAVIAGSYVLRHAFRR